MTTPRIFALGWYGAGNFGDELLLQILHDWVLAAGAELSVASVDPEYTRRIHGMPAVDLFDLPAVVSRIAQSDIVMLGGGGLFHSHFGFGAEGLYDPAATDVTLFARPLLAARQLGVPTLAWAQGVGPLDTLYSREVVADLFNAARWVSVRDEASLTLIRQAGFHGEAVVAPDPAWTFEVPERAAETCAGHGRRIAVVPRYWPPIAGWEDRFVDALASTLSPDDVLVWIPFQPREVPGRSDSDLALVQALMSRFSGAAVQQLLVCHTPAEAIAEIGRCNAMVSMRLHASIMASLLSVPTINLEYDPKMSAAGHLAAGRDVRVPLESGVEVWREAFRGWYEGIGRPSAPGSQAPFAALGDAHRKLLHRAIGEVRMRRRESTWTATAFDWLGTWNSDLLHRRIREQASELGRTAEREARLERELKELKAQLERELGVRTAFELELAEARASIEAWRETSQAIHARLAEKNAEAESLESRLRTAIVELHDANAAAEAFAQKASGLEEQCMTLELERASKTARADELARELELLRARIDEHERAATILAEQMQSLDLKHRSTRSELDAVLQSRSWRWTGFLRAANRRLGQAHWRGQSVARKVLSPASVLYQWASLSWYQYQFATYRRARARIANVNWSGLDVPCARGLVTVVLPVFNGEDYIEESVRSVLRQTYANIELLVIDDGSTDGTAAIVDRLAGEDPRMRVIHQPNMKLPRTLSRGFREARGEFLTWTSADNRMKADCVETMVKRLETAPAVDMVYANIDIIGPEGEPLLRSGWYADYQRPAGSQHIHLPRSVSDLNVWPNNYIGAAFMYRARVARLLGDYSANRFCTEDYDYWMRVNNVFNLRHVGIGDPIYDYRFHPASLTSRDKELRITENRQRLMCFEDFRRSFLLSPVMCVVETVDGCDAASALARSIESQLRRSGHILVAPEVAAAMSLPEQWVPMAWIRVVATCDSIGNAPEVPAGMVTFAVSASARGAGHVSGEWSAAIVHNATSHPHGSGWSAAADVATIVSAVDVVAKERQLASIEAEAESQAVKAPLDASVVICTYRRSETLPAALRSVVAQTIDKRRFELIVVNNDPADPTPRTTVASECDGAFAAVPEHVRIVDCPIAGLSHARNAGISASRGRVLLFLDDDAVADPDCLEKLLEAYAASDRVGIVGGHIVLDPPTPKPEVLIPGREGLWSHFVTGHDDVTVVRNWWEFPWGANWSARRDVLFAIGGFRSNFGRIGNDFGGGEELVAASLARSLGFEVAIQPAARVLHRVERRRFTREHVKKTVRSGMLVAYQMQKSMYLPREHGIWSVARAVVGDWLRTLAVPGVRAALEVDRLVESTRRRARRELLWLMVVDYWNRLIMRP